MKMGVALGLLAVAQLFTSEEGLAVEALATGLAVMFLVALHPRSVAARYRHALRAAAIAAAVFTAMTFWALRFQFFSGPQRITSGTVQPPNIFVSDLANFVVPTQVQALSPASAVHMAAQWTGNLSEWDAYLGIPLVLVSAYIVIRFWRRPAVRVAGLVAVVMALLSLGPNLHINRHDTGFPLPWRAFAKVPLVGHVLPGRLMLPVFLMVAVLVAILADHLLSTRSWRRIGPGATGCLAAAAVAITLLPSVTYPSTKVTVPAFFTDGSVHIIPDGSVALIAPFQQLYPADPMLWQATAGMRFRMPQGYFFAPDDKGRARYGAPYSQMSVAMLEVQQGGRPDLTPERRTQIAQDLATREVETVVVGPMDHQAEMIQLFENVFDVSPVRYGNVYVWPRAQRLLR
jgi:hypothetical protein